MSARHTTVVAASQDWATVRVRTPTAMPVTFAVQTQDGTPIFEWVRSVEGDYVFTWRGRTDNGVEVPTGRYQLSVSSPDFAETFAIRVASQRPGPDDGPPAPPQDVSATAAQNNWVRWSEPTDPDVVTWLVQRSSDSNGPWIDVSTTAVPELRDVPPVPGIYFYRVVAIDLAGNWSDPSSVVSSDNVAMTLEVGPDGGDLVPTTGTVALHIPAGAVAADTVFTIRQVPHPPDANTNRILVSRSFELGPTGTQFDSVAPATLTLAFEIPPEYPLPTGYPEDMTVIQVWSADQWVTTGVADVDLANGTVTVQMAHLSLYAAASVTDPHGGYSDSTNLCLNCHDVHGAASPTYLFAQLTEKETCYQCHDGTGASTDIRSAFGESVIGASTKTSYHPVPAATDGYELVCSDCHTPHKLRSDITELLRVWDGSTWLYSPTATPIGNTYCYTCHGSGATYPGLKGWDHSPFDGSAHGLLIAKDPAKAEIQCLECHQPHGSDYTNLTIADQEQTCFVCHTALAPNTSGGSNPYEAFTAAVNDTTTTDGDPIRIYHHPIATADQDGGTRQVECASCHNPHLADQDDGSSTSKLVDPSDVTTRWIVTWDTGSADLTRGDIASFCEQCHIDPATTAPISAGATVPYDIRLVDDTGSTDDDGRPHDRFTAAIWEDTSGGDKHGPRLGNLACTACHDFHGSSNAYMLKENMVSPDGTTTATFTNYDAMWESRGNLQLNFCLVCHTSRGTNHQNNKLCTQCHYHGSGRF
ncbi:MAG: hypothetical protein GWP04_05205 [Gammaproteobacteria bacterium]|nr:hypothetical protein [Gammaproteobacteria bacterium]